MNNKRQKLYIGSNLKMYKTVSETISYLNELVELTSDISRDELCLFIIPSFTALHEASQRVDHHLIKLGAQNMFWEEKGPWTGEISPIMLREMEIDIVEIGHSERRQWFGETDFTVNKKVLAGLRHNLITLICIGETMQDKTLGINVERLRQQVKIALHGVSEDRLHNVWIAYEPVWAIGESGTPATPEYASSMHGVLRQVLKELYPKEAASIPLLYGGSVNSSNAKALIVQPEIDGLFIGRAAWDAASFNSLIRSIQEA
jgi:triosephosphate isomerase